MTIDENKNLVHIDVSEGGEDDTNSNKNGAPDLKRSKFTGRCRIASFITGLSELVLRIY